MANDRAPRPPAGASSTTQTGVQHGNVGATTHEPGRHGGTAGRGAAGRVSATELDQRELRQSIHRKAPGPARTPGPALSLGSAQGLGPAGGTALDSAVPATLPTDPA
jgi:hypothetical protein